jgi:hypothetical protein
MHLPATEHHTQRTTPSFGRQFQFQNKQNLHNLVLRSKDRIVNRVDLQRAPDLNLGAVQEAQ